MWRKKHNLFVRFSNITYTIVHEILASMKKHEILIHYISLQCNRLALSNMRLSLIEVNNVNRMPRCCYLSKTNALSYQVDHIRFPNLAIFTGESLRMDYWILWRLDYWICLLASFFVILGTSYVRWHRFVKVSRKVGEMPEAIALACFTVGF